MAMWRAFAVVPWCRRQTMIVDDVLGNQVAMGVQRVHAVRAASSDSGLVVEFRTVAKSRLAEVVSHVVDLQVRVLAWIRIVRVPV
eukprot:6560131-Pyramimonas_sp.AAC.1